VWCSKIPSSGVQALAQDAENDVMLNIISLSFPVSPRFAPATGIKLTPSL
jgi:hypothetical protein